MDFPVFDLHCDTSNELIGTGYTEFSELRENSAHIDLQRAGKLSGYAQCFACFTTTDTGTDPKDIFGRKLSALLREVDKNSDLIHFAHSGDEIERNKKDGIMSAILTIEGTAGFDFDWGRLEELHEIGFRMSTLGWNESNRLTGSNLTGGGLTSMGRDYLRELQRFKMLVDVSHISDEGFWDIIELTTAPVVASHSNSRAMCNHSRNITDEMFKAICKTDGVVGINLYSLFLGENPTFDTVCDHIIHFLNFDPEGKHIALGGDLDGCESFPKGFHGVQDYPKLADSLLKRGLSEQMVYDIFWNNAVRVFSQIR